MGVIAMAIVTWFYLRLPETLAPEDVRPFTVASILDGFRIVLTNRIALFYTLSSTFIFGALFGFINSAQQIYVGIYELGRWFPSRSLPSRPSCRRLRSSMRGSSAATACAFSRTAR